jgi:hypothetical protein
MDNIKESVSDSWNEGFEAGIDFAKTHYEAMMNPFIHNNPQPTEHEFGCLIYICTCKVK